MITFSSFTAFISCRWEFLKNKNLPINYEFDELLGAYQIWCIDQKNIVFCCWIWNGEIPWSIGRSQEENDIELTDFKQTVGII